MCDCGRASNKHKLSFLLLIGLTFSCRAVWGLLHKGIRGWLTATGCSPECPLSQWSCFWMAKLWAPGGLFCTTVWNCSARVLLPSSSRALWLPEQYLTTWVLFASDFSKLSTILYKASRRITFSLHLPISEPFLTLKIAHSAAFYVLNHASFIITLECWSCGCIYETNNVLSFWALKSQVCHSN